MASCEGLLERAKSNANSLRFHELCRLAECHGFELMRQKGSHRIYKLAGQQKLMNFQNDHGRAKAYQVKQRLEAIGEEP